MTDNDQLRLMAGVAVDENTIRIDYELANLADRAVFVANILRDPEYFPEEDDAPPIDGLAQTWWAGQATVVMRLGEVPANVDESWVAQQHIHALYAQFGGLAVEANGRPRIAYDPSASDSVRTFESLVDRLHSRRPSQIPGLLAHARDFGPLWTRLPGNETKHGSIQASLPLSEWTTCWTPSTLIAGVEHTARRIDFQVDCVFEGEDLSAVELAEHPGIFQIETQKAAFDRGDVQRASRVLDVTAWLPRIEVRHDPGWVSLVAADT